MIATSASVFVFGMGVNMQVSLVICLLTAITHPFATAVVSVACFLGFRLVQHVWTSGMSLSLGFIKLGPARCAGLIIASLCCSVIATFGTIIFTFIGIATAVVATHATLRQVQGAEAEMAVAASDREHIASLHLAEVGGASSTAGRTTKAESPPSTGESTLARPRHKAGPANDPKSN